MCFEGVQRPTRVSPPTWKAWCFHSAQFRNCSLLNNQIVFFFFCLIHSQIECMHFYGLFPTIKLASSERKAAQVHFFLLCLRLLFCPHSHPADLHPRLIFVCQLPRRDFHYCGPLNNFHTFYLFSNSNPVRCRVGTAASDLNKKIRK